MRAGRADAGLSDAFAVSAAKIGIFSTHARGLKSLLYETFARALGVNHLHSLTGFSRRARKTQRAPVKTPPRECEKSSHKSAPARNSYQAFQRRLHAEKSKRGARASAGERGRHNAFPHKSLLASAEAGPVNTSPRECGKFFHKRNCASAGDQTGFSVPRARR